MYHPFYFGQLPHYHPNPPLGIGTYPDTIYLGGRVFSRSSYSTTNQAAPAAPAPLRSLRPGNIPVSQVQAGAGNDQGTTNHKSSIKRSQTFMSQAQQRGGIAGDSGPPSQQHMPMQPQPIYLQHQPPFNIHPFLPPFQGWPQQQNIHQNTPKQEDGPSQADSGALTHYASPHPRMYPYVPPRTQPMPFHSMMPTPPPAGPPGQHSFQPGMMNLAQPASAMSSMSAQLYNMPLGQVPPKLKCNDCGRERSSKYQWKHRKSRGQKAEPNICRRCRKSGTDSEYETESSEDERDLPRRSRSRHYSRGRTSRAQSRARSKPRSSSRPNRRGDFDFYAYHDVDNSDSDSGDSEDYQRNQSRSIRRRSRSRSGNLGRARNSQLRHSISRPRKVVYVEPRHDQVDFHSDDEDIGVRYVDRHARPVFISRPSTPAMRVQPSIQLETDLRTPIVIERREYYEEPWLSDHPTRPPPQPIHRHDSIVALQDSRYGVESDGVAGEERYHEIGTDGASRGRGIRNSARSRSRSHFSIDEGAESGFYDRLLRRASSPARMHRRSSRSAEFDSSREDDKVERRSHRSDSRRPRLKDSDGSRRRSSTPPDDYDWYDKDGMKVRVREI